MHKIPASTLFLGKNLVFVPECHSTNTLCSDLAVRTETPEGTLVITANQTAGRGQRGNTWLVEPGMNFTFSFLLKPRFLLIKEQFFLSIAVSLGLTDYLYGYFSEGVKIKWPNDILIDEKKICGILIENQLSGSLIHQSIVGIGLNVNQKQFPTPTASSMALLSGKAYDLTIELEKLLINLEARYLQLKQERKESLMADYLQRMFRRNEIHQYSAKGEIFDGEITGVDDFGRLLIKSKEKLQPFDIKEVTYLNP